MITWIWRVISGRGTGPGRNRSLSRGAQREQIVSATMDLWRVGNKRDSVLEQLDRFRRMADGKDGGPLKAGEKLSLRKAHYKRWKDADFAALVEDLEVAIAEAKSREAAANELLKGTDHEDA